MKKLFLLAGVALISAAGMGQIKDVKKVQGMIAGEGANYDAAREIIQAALTNDETKDLANTWYVAGLIGYNESNAELNKVYMGLSVDYNVVGAAQQESYKYWLKADELAQVLVMDKKGNMVMDKKNISIRKSIADKMLQYYQNQGLLGYAGSFYEKQDYAATYELYKLYSDIPDLPMMQDEKMQNKMVRDTVYQDIRFSTGQLAYSAEKYNEAIPIFQVLMHGDFKAASAGEYLYSCYLNMKDSAKAYAVMDECIELFPQEERFLQTRINAYVAANDYDNAIALLDKAIAQNPQAQYYNSKGSILSMQYKFDEAVEVFRQGLTIDPNNANLYTNYGYVFVEKAKKLNDEAGYLDDAAYQKVKDQIDAAYQEALPLFEKARSIDPDNYDCERALKSIYYRLGMMDKYEAL